MIWDTIVATRAYAFKLGCFMFALAVIVSFTTIKVPAATLFTLFGMWGFSAHQILGQLANMQARLDMKRIARGELPE